MSVKGKLFFAEAQKGYTFKVLVDSLAGALSRAVFQLTKTGVFSRNADPNCHILYDFSLYRENFRRYAFTKPVTFSVNVKHLQKMVRNIKKKDSVAIFIDKTNPDRMGLLIRPDSGSKDSSRSETIYITIQHENIPNPLILPEYCENEDGKSKKVYGFPMVIGSQDFQKIKKMSSVGKVIMVRMQKSNYISFYCDAGEIYSNELSFGEVVDNPDSDSDDSERSESAEEVENGKVDDASESGSSDSEEEVETDEIKGWYEAEFYMNIFSLLVKLPGLCTQMQFFAPKVERYPLKIMMEAGNLGDIKIFIKDIEQILREESMRDN